MKNMKKVHVINLIVSAIIVVLGAVGCYFFSIKDFDGSAGKTILFFACIAVIIVGVIWGKIAFSNYLKYCHKCGASMEGCAYEYQEISRHSIQNSNDYKVNVQINATCPHCGASNTTSKTFRVRPGENPQFLVDSWCRRHYKH